jgi:hypothetical protein
LLNSYKTDEYKLKALLLLGGAASVPAIVVHDVAIRALSPRVRLVSNLHVRHICSGVVVGVEHDVVHSEQTSHTSHNYWIEVGRENSNGEGERKQENSVRKAETTTTITTPASTNKGRHTSTATTPESRTKDISYSLALYFFHWMVSAFASSGDPLISRLPALLMLRVANCERPNILSETSCHTTVDLVTPEAFCKSLRFCLLVDASWLGRLFSEVACLHSEAVEWQTRLRKRLPTSMGTSFCQGIGRE